MYANGFGPTSDAVVSGSATQSGMLPALPVVTIGGKNADVAFAGLISPGLYQFNVTVPPDVPNGDAPIVATFGGGMTQAGVLLTVQQ